MSRQMFIDSEWVRSSTGRDLPVYNPATGKVIERVPEASRDDVGRAVDAAREAFDNGSWSKLPPGDRANILLRVAGML